MILKFVQFYDFKYCQFSIDVLVQIMILYVYMYIYILRYSELSSLRMILLWCQDQNVFFENDIIVISRSKFFFFICSMFSGPNLFCVLYWLLYILGLYNSGHEIFEIQTYNLVQLLVIHLLGVWGFMAILLLWFWG